MHRRCCETLQEHGVGFLLWRKSPRFRIVAVCLCPRPGSLSTSVFLRGAWGGPGRGEGEAARGSGNQNTHLVGTLDLPAGASVASRKVT